MVVLDDGDEHLTPSMRLLSPLITLQPLQEAGRSLMSQHAAACCCGRTQMTTNRCETTAPLLWRLVKVLRSFASLLVCYSR